MRYGDGRVRPTVYTLGARTGRMSCVRPNCQNVPRSGGVRGCIIADSGHLLISADFAGIELRVAAALSGDTQLARIIAALRSRVFVPTRTITSAGHVRDSRS